MQTLFPIPKCHADQQLILSLEELFRDRLRDFAKPGWDNTDKLLFPLDDLRSSIEQGTWRHLVQMGVLDEDDYLA